MHTKEMESVQRTTWISVFVCVCVYVGYARWMNEWMNEGWNDGVSGGGGGDGDNNDGGNNTTTTTTSKRSKWTNGAHKTWKTKTNTHRERQG